MDYYHILGAQYDDPPGKIKALYHMLAFALHPDQSGAADQEAFHRCAEAYKVLHDPDRRKTYNIEQVILVQPRRLKPGYDLHQQLSLAPEQGLEGGAFSLCFKRWEPCSRCWLSGCSWCGKVGQIAVDVAVKVYVPKGTTQPIRLIVPHQGGCSEPKGPRGDLFVQLKIS